MFLLSQYSEVCLNVKTVTKKWGHENSWSLGSCSSPTGTSKFGSNQASTHECCQAPGSYELTCNCSYGDGWHGGYLEIQGKKYCEGFVNGHVNKEQVTITGTNSISYIKRTINLVTIIQFSYILFSILQLSGILARILPPRQHYDFIPSKTIFHETAIAANQACTEKLKTTKRENLIESVQIFFVIL